MAKHYVLRTTEDKLSERYDYVINSGDTVLHVVYKGGRDYTLICKAAHQ